MSKPAELPTLSTLVTSFTSFLTVAIHTILHLRNCYPPSTFLTARKYNFPVSQSRHPRVCQWIQDAVSAVETEMLKGGVARVALVIFDVSGETTTTTTVEGSSGDTDSNKGGVRPLERYVFDVERFPVVPPTEVNTPILRQEPKVVGSKSVSKTGKSGIETLSKAPTTPPNAVSVDEQFRSILSRLSHLPSRLAPIPQGCPFTISIELKDEAEDQRPIGHPQAWIPSEPNLQNTVLERSNEAYGGDRKTQTLRGDELGGSKKMVPLRAVSAGEMVFEMWVEEGKAKDRFHGGEDDILE